MATTGNRPARQIFLDARALDNIAEILRDPEWAPGMLEDIAERVRATGRDTSNVYECEYCGVTLHCDTDDDPDDPTLGPDNSTLCEQGDSREHDAISVSTWERH